MSSQQSISSLRLQELNQLELPEQARHTLEQYLTIKLGQFIVPCTYWYDHESPSGASVTGYLGGKGTPQEIQEKAKTTFSQAELELLSTPEQAQDLLRQFRIGVDCSGFAFNLLESFAQDFNKASLESEITPTPDGNPENPKRFRTNADYLTRSENSKPITGYVDIKPGDLIRHEKGKHVMVIIGYQDNIITYAHSSRSAITHDSGVHIRKITIKDVTNDLRQQNWSELTRKEHSFSTLHHPDAGDGIFRLKWW